MITCTHSELHCCQIPTLEVWNWPPYMEGKERPQKEADHSRPEGGRLRKQENLLTRLVLGQSSRSLHLATRILKSLYRGLNWVPSCVQSRWFQRHMALLNLHAWNSSHCGESEQDIHFKDWEVGRSLWFPGSPFEGQLMAMSSQRPLQQLQEGSPELRESQSFLVGENVHAFCYRWRHYAHFSELQASELFALEQNATSVFQGCSLY